MMLTQHQIDDADHKQKAVQRSLVMNTLLLLVFCKSGQKYLDQIETASWDFAILCDYPNSLSDSSIRLRHSNLDCPIDRSAVSLCLA